MSLPRGAGNITRNAEKMETLTGVEASNRIALLDKDSVNTYKKQFEIASKNTGIPPELLAAIASRESHVGKYLKNGRSPNYPNNKGFGIMQVDEGYHKLQGTWDSLEHITQAANILKDFISIIKSKFPEWSEEQRVQGGVAAYNCGPNNVRSWTEVDERTTSKDYSADVMQRAEFYKKNINWSKSEL